MINPKLNLVPIGVISEVLIGEARSSLGYLAKRELTNTTFIPNRYIRPGYAVDGCTTVQEW